MFRKLWLPIIVVATTFSFVLIVAKTAFWVYFDLPSFAIVPVLSSLVPCLIFGASGLRTAFSAPFAKSATKLELQTSIAFFKALGTSAWVFGLIGTIMGTVAMMYNIDDRSQIGPNMALALLTLFYAVMVWAVIILPFTLNAKEKLAETER